VRHEQIDTLSFAQHEEIFALAVTDEKSTWDHMQSTVKIASFSFSLSHMWTPHFISLIIFANLVSREAVPVDVKINLDEYYKTNLIIFIIKYSV